MNDCMGQWQGKYRLIRLLGQGDLANVYLSTQPDVGMPVAIKIFHTRLTDEEMERFRAGIAIIAGLRHPSIVRVLDVGVEDGRPFWVMDYAPGGSLRQKYSDGAPLAPTDILPFVRQIADALQYAHDRQVYHGDIKPENLLLGENGEVLISDFSTTSMAQLAHLRQVKAEVGVSAYLAPEQFQGKLSPASDQYALGVVVYEWLSDTPPFQEVSSDGQVSTLCPTMLETLQPLLPMMKQAMLRALSKDPEGRFPSVSAFAQALEHACQIEPAPDALFASAFQVSASASSPPAVRQNRGLSRRSLLVGGLAGLIGAGAVTGLVRLLLPRFLPLYTYRGHADAVTAVAWAPDGGRIASSSSDASVQVWGATDGSNVLIYRGHAGPVETVAWSPDGRRIASGGSDATVQVWGVRSGNILLTYRGHPGSVNAVAWSPDGQRIASGGDARDQTSAGNVLVWDAQTGKTLQAYHGQSSGINTVAWAPDGQRIASAGEYPDYMVHVWDASTGAPLRRYSGHSAPVRAVAWAPNGNYLAAASDDQTVQVWDALTGTPLVTYLSHFAAVHAVAWAADSQQVASGGDDSTVQVWEGTTGITASIYRGHTDSVTTIAWSPDSKLLASGGADRTVRVWQAG